MTASGTFDSCEVAFTVAPFYLVRMLQRTSRPGSSRRASLLKPISCPPAANGCTRSSTTDSKIVVEALTRLRSWSCIIEPSRCQRRRLPFQPAINPGTSNRNRFISRSLKRDLCGVRASRIRNHHGPLIAAGARKNEKLNTLVVHGTRHYHV
jgi:hypothetical protein